MGLSKAEVAKAAVRVAFVQQAREEIEQCGRGLAHAMNQLDTGVSTLDTARVLVACQDHLLSAVALLLDNQKRAPVNSEAEVITGV